ncbi:MAG: potassium:proton antiporter [Pseudodesulfovibrio sp.]|nr:potassium:proton antiporter [Pseudodesulfovibrio sp.]
MLKSLGIIAWIGCLLVLAYQGISWILFACWPSLTLMDASHALFGIDYTSFVQSLPLDLAVKTAYLCFSTELSIFLWWTGTAFFALVFLNKILVRK